MRLAITQRVVVNETYPERRDALSQDWAKYIAEILPEAHLVPLLNRPESAVAALSALDIEGVILTGGNDLEDAPERDETESRVIAACRQRGTPLLGVCRGLQMINVALGGSVEMNAQFRTETEHVAANHSIALRGPAFVGLAGGTTLEVNSFHDCAVFEDGLAPLCEAFALAADGVVEGFRHTSEPVLAIQWHPERPNPVSDFDRELISRFLRDGRLVL